MKIPTDLRYTKNDEWIRVEGNTGVIGITDYAQDQLSDVVYVEVSVDEADSINQGESFGAVESVKAASDVYAPASGTVLEINRALEDTPELVNTDPFGTAWMIKVELDDPAELDSLMDAEAYQKYLETREH